MDKMTEFILEVNNLKKYFPLDKNLFGKPARYLKAVDNVSFKLKKGTTIGVVGESGCGKTTLGRTILKLYHPDGGEIFFNGEELTHLSKSQMQKYRTKIQLIFQDPYSSLPPRMTVGNIISEAIKVHHIVPKDEVAMYVQEIMKKCGLPPQYYDRYPHEFSGGQRQRIGIARAIALQPKLIICDEPVSALDVSIQAKIINLLNELQEKMGIAYIFISHDLSVVKHIADRVGVMYLGNMMEMADTESLYAKPLHPYTQALFSAIPRIGKERIEDKQILGGDVPSPANPPKGCRFCTRCPKAMDICKTDRPDFKEVEPGHFCACHLYDKK